MKKILSIFIISLVVFFGVQALAAETEPNLEDLFADTSLQNGVDCFDYYKFQSVQVNVGPNKSAFTAGEDIDFSGKIINENRYPVFNGYVYVRIAEKNPGYIHEGHNITDEFIALGPIAVDASSSVPVSFSWKVPENLKSGNYTANYFFSVNKKMNLGGLPFTNEIIVGFADFSIASTKIGNVSFLKSSTKVNNIKYNHIGNWPLITPNGKATISQVIQNTLKQDLKTEISYNLYYWDSLDPKDLISTKKESITLKAGESKTLTYEIPKVELSAYYLQMVAKNENGTKSIVNMRITSETARPRINYFGLDNFPILKGAKTILYSCFHNTSNISASGAVVLIAKDKMGKEISRVSYAGVIPSSISAEKSDFIVKTNLDYVKLEQKIYDDKNNLLDSQEIVYDASLIKEPETKAEPINPIVVSVLAGLIIFGFLLFTIRPIRKNKNLCLVISLVIISLAGVLLVLFLEARPVKAQSTLGAGFQVSQGGAIGKSFGVGFIENYKPEKNKMDVRTAYAGFAGYTYEIITTAPSSTLAIGRKFNFIASTTGEFFKTGGSFDSPYFGTIVGYQAEGNNYPTKISMDAAKWVPTTETVGFSGDCVKDDVNASSNDCIGGGAVGGDNDYEGKITSQFKGADVNPPDFRYGFKKEADIPKIESIVSSNPGVISCSSSGCEAVGPGIATVTVSIGPSEVILGYSYPFAFRLFNASQTGFRDSIPFEGFNATWQFEVLPSGTTPPPPGGTTPPPAGPGTCIQDNWNCDGIWLPTTCPMSGIQTQICTNTQTSTTTCTTVSVPSDTKTCTYLLPPGATYLNAISTCSATQEGSTKIFVNKQMKWTVNIPSGLSLSTYDIQKTEWSGASILAGTETSSNILSKIYTTVGLKNISATTTAKSADGNTIYTITCSTSTNVIFGGGGSQEI